MAAVILVYAFDRGGIASGYFIRGTCDSLAVVAIAPGAIIVHPVIRGFLEGDQS